MTRNKLKAKLRLIEGLREIEIDEILQAVLGEATHFIPIEDEDEGIIFSGMMGMGHACLFQDMEEATALTVMTATLIHHMPEGNGNDILRSISAKMHDLTHEFPSYQPEPQEKPTWPQGQRPNSSNIA